MKHFPLFFDLHGQHCLVIGGGAVALRKASLLSKAGAVIHIVSPEINDDLAFIAEKSQGQVFRRAYEKADLADKTLVIAATNDRQVNEQVSKDAKANNQPVNVVDNPDLCSFILPSIIDRSPLTIAVSSGGASPVLARMIRSRIESMIPSAYGRLAEFVGLFRDKVKQELATEGERRRFWESALEGPIAEKVLTGKPEDASRVFEASLAKRHDNQPGEVCLVGAGPGDPDLLTFKALRLLQSADVILYDRLVSPAIVDLARRDAERVYVGKAKSDHAVPQQEINQLLIDYARKGLRVVRLKGGDPFIFGRGGEEIEELAELGIPFQVVPGITAASGCASYAGIPLTHRDYAQSVRFVTGHLKDDGDDLNWSELVGLQQTVVFYMGLSNLEKICAQLIAHGRAESTPVAIVQKGTTPEQRVIIGDLKSLPAEVAKQKIKAPTLIIVGEVVELHKKLSWFNTEVTP
ncbi:MAG: uroporphyrinogen-III C-methyltransferase [Pseudomonadales bacterium]|nr:uroporphyrinogen-III C-methyltransferase [Pseudomonadales bacterium]